MNKILLSSSDSEGHVKLSRDWAPPDVWCIYKGVSVKQSPDGFLNDPDTKNNISNESNHLHQDPHLADLCAGHLLLSLRLRDWRTRLGLISPLEILTRKRCGWQAGDGVITKHQTFRNVSQPEQRGRVQRTFCNSLCWPLKIGFPDLWLLTWPSLYLRQD